ncbi:MAG: dephospho-CoA kinase [Planctomycetota bacterium]|jgi:dephospho-CoA kinase
MPERNVAFRRPVIGLAGAIGAGKSAVAATLAEAGCVVADADAATRAILGSPEAAETLAAWWGMGILAEDGTVDRAAVARIVFADPAERKRLEGFVHPRVQAARAAIFAAAPAEAPALVVDAPLLFEAGLDGGCDHIVFVDCPRAIRLERVAEHRGWSDEELARREAAQWPLDRKRQRADSVLVNDADLASLRTKVLDLLKRILAEFRDRPRDEESSDRDPAQPEPRDA